MRASRTTAAPFFFGSAGEEDGSGSASRPTDDDGGVPSVPDEAAVGEDESGAPQPGAQTTSVLGHLAIDLTEIAVSRHAPPLGLWDHELRRLKEILQKREKHAAAIVGPDGVGKRALVIALAREIAEGRVPERLSGRRIFELPFHRAIASVRESGDFERIVFSAMREAATRTDVILFLSQITSFMGVIGARPELFNASYVIEMACHQPGLYILGSATPELYREMVASRPWCDSVMTRVPVSEPSREGTVGLLAGPVSALAQYHGVDVESAAVEAAVDLSNYYIKERVLPGKAVELLDEAAARAAVGSIAGGNGRPRVTERHVSEALSDWVGIPVDKLSGSVNHELLGLEDALRRRVKGQDHCVKKLADVIRVAKLGLDARPVRPDGTFLFVGPSGVGKSELASVLSDELYGDPARLIRFNMTRYSDDDGLARLVGVKLGDLDYPGELTSRILRHPHSVVVFDQLERSHRDVALLLMQIITDGFVVDGHGVKVAFSNTTVIMTMNSENIVPEQEDKESVGFGSAFQPSVEERRLHDVREAVERFFPAEFMDGIDEVLIFEPLGPDSLREIVELHLSDVRERLSGRQVTLRVSAKAVDKMVEKGHSREYGARNLGRTVEGMVLKPLARFMLAHSDVKDITVKVVEGDIEVGETVAQ